MPNLDAPAVDLVKLAGLLEPLKQYRIAYQKLRRALNTDSCLLDLKEALSCVASLDAILSSDLSKNLNHAIHARSAITNYVLSLYIRAVASNSKGSRGSIDISCDYSEDEKKIHADLYSIRSEVIAHVYINKVVAGKNRHDATLMIAYDEGLPPCASGSTSRIVHDPDLIEKLKAVLPSAARLMQSRMSDRYIEVIELVHEHRDEPAFKRLFQASLSTPRQILKTSGERERYEMDQRRLTLFRT